MSPNPMKPVTHLDIDRYMGRCVTGISGPLSHTPEGIEVVCSILTLNIPSRHLKRTLEGWGVWPAGHVQGCGLMGRIFLENNMDNEIYNKMLEKATEEGYDVSKLEKTVHTNPPPKSEEGPKEVGKDTKGIWFISSLFGK
ncbi:hypothetical protein QQ045_000269 [Rhodiola kirilowii]